LSRVVTVVSRDPQLARYCHEAIRVLGAPVWRVEVFSEDSRTPAEGICLIDADAGFGSGKDHEGGVGVPRPSGDLADGVSAGVTTIYLVSRHNLESLCRRIPSAEGHILLKPVTLSVLQAYLGSLMQVTEELGLLRADRDSILQFLFQANLRLQEYDRQRTSFLAQTAHDLRSPLSAVEGFLALMSDGHLGPLTEPQAEAMSRAHNSVRRLLRMSTALFDLSIAGKAEQRLELEQGDILECLRQALTETLHLATEKDINLALAHYEPPGEGLYFERGRIEQVMVNLLDNACKATPRGGSISISAGPYFWERRYMPAAACPTERRRNQVRLPNAYRIDVQDTGPGIPPDRLEEVFEEYTSYFGSNNRPGGGLGLAICRLIMRRHRGRIWAESNGNGAVLSFVLPYRDTEPLRRFAGRPETVYDGAKQSA
jgi:signal transduction histidine kinase